MVENNFAVAGVDFFIKGINENEILGMRNEYGFDINWSEEVCTLTKRFDRRFYATKEELMEIIQANMSLGEDLCRIHGGEYMGSELYLEKV